MLPFLGKFFCRKWYLQFHTNLLFFKKVNKAQLSGLFWIYRLWGFKSAFAPSGWYVSCTQSPVSEIEFAVVTLPGKTFHRSFVFINKLKVWISSPPTLFCQRSYSRMVLVPLPWVELLPTTSGCPGPLPSWPWIITRHWNTACWSLVVCIFFFLPIKFFILVSYLFPPCLPPLQDNPHIILSKHRDWHLNKSNRSQNAPGHWWNPTIKTALVGLLRLHFFH